MTGSATAARGTWAARALAALGGSDVPAPARADEPTTVERPRHDVPDL